MAIKSAPQMKPGAGGTRANAINDTGKQGYGKKNPAKRPGKSGDNPRSGKASPFAKK